jgi:hypothetical protein
MNVWQDSIRTTDYKTYESEDFSTESEMQGFIDINAKFFAENILEIEYQGHKKEYQFFQKLSLGASTKRKPLLINENPFSYQRVDFVFFDKEELIIVEAKKPRNAYNENLYAVSQIMAYKSLAKISGKKVKRMVLVTTKYTNLLREVIVDFKLPIEVYIFSKTNCLKVTAQVTKAPILL